MTNETCDVGRKQHIIHKNAVKHKDSFLMDLHEWWDEDHFIAIVTG
jgi:hypothetical protein